MCPQSTVVVVDKMNITIVILVAIIHILYHPFQVHSKPILRVDIMTHQQIPVLLVLTLALLDTYLQRLEVVTHVLQTWCRVTTIRLASKRMELYGVGVAIGFANWEPETQ